jgi:hypothetical protein
MIALNDHMKERKRSPRKFEEIAQSLKSTERGIQAVLSDTWDEDSDHKVHDSQTSSSLEEAKQCSLNVEQYYKQLYLDPVD